MWVKRFLAVTPLIAAMALLTPGLAASNPSSTLKCSSSEEISRSNLELDGGRDPAIIVDENCVLELRDSKVQSDGTAILVRGNGELLLDGVEVAGKRSMELSSNAVVRVVDSKIEGSIDKRHNAKFIDLGDNRF